MTRHTVSHHIRLPLRRISNQNIQHVVGPTIGNIFDLQMQKGWIWPTRAGDSSMAITATVKTREGGTLTGQVTQVSDFRITVVDRAGQTHLINREPGVDVQINDPLAAHQEWIMTLTNDDMHNATAYLETLK